MRVLLARVRGLVTRTPCEPDFSDEIDTHMRLLTERFVRQGMAPADAAMAARRQFGNVTRLKLDRQDLRTLPAVEAMGRAVRFAARQLRASPMFTATAVLSLALGIGANTAVFTLLDQLVLRLLPVADPERLVMIWSTGPTLGSSRGPRASSFPLCADFQVRAVALDSVFCRFVTDAAVTVDKTTTPVTVELVSGNYFHALGVGQSLGRVFSGAVDDRIDRGHPVVVLSHRFWMERFGASPGVIGKKILINTQPMEVVGVAAAGFNGIDAAQSPQLWLSLRMKGLLTPDEDGLHDRDLHFVQIFGRLRAGDSPDSARAALQPLFTQILQEELHNPDVARASALDRERFLKRTVVLERAARGYSETRRRYSTPLLVLMGMAALILLMACSNVASLLIARGMARHREMAVRLSIGAGRRTLIGQLLVESLLLAVAGTALGLALSVVATQTLLAMLPSTNGLPLLHPEPDLRILAVSVTVSVATVLLFGLVPALQTTRVDLANALKASSGTVSAAARSTRVRKILVASQVGLSFLLLIGAGLFARTLINLKGVDTGLKGIDEVVTFHVDPARNGYAVPQVRRFYSDLTAKIGALPGVTAAAYAWIPVLQPGAPNWAMHVEGYDGQELESDGNVVSPGYWAALGMPLLDGRDFDDRDRVDSGVPGQLPTVAIVNRSFARRFFGTSSAIGKRFGIGDRRHDLEIRIIGVVEDALHAGPRPGIRPQVYFSFLQANFPVAAVFYVRTDVRPAALTPALRRTVTELDPTMPIYEMKTLDRVLDDTLGAERLIAALSVVFALLATVIAALGLYGVVSFSVERRTKEIGMRTALGASPASVLWLVMREVLSLLGLGLFAGIPCAFVLTQYATPQLFGVAPSDAWVASAAVATLAVVAIVAGVLPAHRARTLDPLVALRGE